MLVEPCRHSGSRRIKEPTVVSDVDLRQGTSSRDVKFEGLVGGQKSCSRQ